MQRWLRHTVLTGGALALVWLCVLWYWRMAGSSSGTAAPLPGVLLLVAAFALLPTLHRRFAGSMAGSRRGAEAASDDSSVAPQAPPPASMQILASALRMPGAVSAAELAQGLRSRKVRPQLDPELHDEKGFPILSGPLALAHDEAAENGGHALCVSNLGPSCRGVALVTPAAASLDGAAGHAPGRQPAATG
jgi:hypothetical protein